MNVGRVGIGEIVRGVKCAERGRDRDREKKKEGEGEGEREGVSERVRPAERNVISPSLSSRPFLSLVSLTNPHYA